MRWLVTWVALQISLVAMQRVPHESAVVTERFEINRKIKVHPNHIHECIFSIKLRNLEMLEPLLWEISDPDHPSYGDYLSSVEMGSLIQNLEAVSATEAYLSQFNGVKLKSKTIHGQLLTFSAPIHVWEQILSTKFYTFEVTDFSDSKNSVIRAEEYFMPEQLLPHVAYVLNTVQMPVISLSRSVSSPKMHTQSYTPPREQSHPIFCYHTVSFFTYLLFYCLCNILYILLVS